MKHIKHKRGIAILTYNRSSALEEILDSVVKTQSEGTRLVVCDDGSTDNTCSVVAKFPQFVYIRGENKGVVANKNRALFALQDCEYVSLIEDDLVPTLVGWFEVYEQASILSGIHHFCSVQDKEIPEIIPAFQQYMNNHNLTPIYGFSPRGDFTFLTSTAIKTVGAFNPNFIGAGFGHGEYAERIYNAGLIPHPNKWVDIKEARDSFHQKGDQVGGRWEVNPEIIQSQLDANKELYETLKQKEYIHYPLILY